jgi:hypothetical protein
VPAAAQQEGAAPAAACDCQDAGVYAVTSHEIKRSRSCAALHEPT